jgi:hypothetical protein
MTVPTPSQDLTDVLVDLVNFATSAVNFISDDLLPFVPLGLEVAGGVLENIVEPAVDDFEQTACGG